ncbi:MAG: MaoC family dehydratase [Chloroflexaceae bacterium]|jgi:acyl dehydratase|nr:MaoC family dehydratase [Chloroflexaceae bacterium]
MLYDELTPGDALPTLTLPPVTHNQLVRYSGASGDYNPLHTDPSFARQAGLPDVIAHGMLVMGMLGRMATDLAGPGQVRRFGVRFTGKTELGDIMTCSGVVAEKREENGERRMRCTVQAANQRGEVKASGSFEVAMGTTNDAC